MARSCWSARHDPGAALRHARPRRRRRRGLGDGCAGAAHRRGAGASLHKRCVDLSDLLASAATGLARAALVSSRLPGLDADTVATLARAGVGTVVVLDDDAGPEARARLHRLGVADVLPAELGGLADALRGAATPAADRTAVGHGARLSRGRPPGRGAASGRGRARTGARSWSGAPPGLPAAPRSRPASPPRRPTAAATPCSSTPTPTAARWPSTSASSTGPPACSPRPGPPTPASSTRSGWPGWPAPSGAGCGCSPACPAPTGGPRCGRPRFEDLLAAAADLAGLLVVDVGFSLEGDTADPFATGPQRNHMTLAALSRADEVVVVGAADPVGLSRLARGLVDLHDLVPDASVTVVVNRTRSTLGWSEHRDPRDGRGLRARPGRALRARRPGGRRPRADGRAQPRGDR